MELNCPAPDAVAVPPGAAVGDAGLAELDVARAVGVALPLADVPEPPQAASAPTRAAETAAWASLVLSAEPAKLAIGLGLHI